MLLLATAASPWAGQAGADPREVALTFDGGPSGFTRKIERILERKDVRASFFWVGSRLAGHGKVVRRVHRHEHVIANHSWDHVDLTKLGPAAVRRQLTGTSERLAELTGERPTLFRPPYGEVNRQVKRIARELGMRTVLWDADSIDWMSDCKAIVSRVLRRVRPGDNVLLHDGGGNRRPTVCALPRIIRKLRARDYRLVTVPELARSAPAAPPAR